jgi:hypothetical protein
MNTHWATSATVRPQPRQTSSNVVEQTATHGVSGRGLEVFCISAFGTMLLIWNESYDGHVRFYQARLPAPKQVSLGGAASGMRGKGLPLRRNAAKPCLDLKQARKRF